MRALIAAVSVVVVLALAGCSLTLYANGDAGIVMNHFKLSFVRTPEPESIVEFNLKTVIKPTHVHAELLLEWWNKHARQGKGAWEGISKAIMGLHDIPPVGRTVRKEFKGYCLKNVRERLHSVWHVTWPSGPPSDDTINYPPKGKYTYACKNTIF